MKIFNKVAMFIVMILCIILTNTIINASNTTYYPQVFQVIAMNEECIYLIDGNGNEWVWEDIDDWEIGDYATAIMDTQDTINIYDDIIIQLRYIRITER